MRLLPIVLTVIFAGCAPPPGANRPASSPQAGAPAPGSVSPAGDPQGVFLAAFRAANEHKDVQQMLRLYCWDGIGAEMRETVRGNVQDELQQPIAEIEIVAVEPGKYGPRDEGGIRWKPNLKVVAELK